MIFLALSLLKSNAAYWTGFCTFPASYTQCFFYYRIASTMNFNRCQRTSIFTYSAGNTSFFIDTCHSFCQCFVPLSNFVSLLYLKKVNPSVILLHSQCQCRLPSSIYNIQFYFFNSVQKCKTDLTLHYLSLPHIYNRHVL